MTARHPNDCYLSSPCTALALGGWLRAEGGLVTLHDALDPFAGAGTLIRWAAESLTRLGGIHAFELDRRWTTELHRNVMPLRVRVGVDSFALREWTVAGGRVPNIITNHPYARTDDAVQRLAEHARKHGRFAATLMRTDWWQHPGRDGHLKPDTMLALKWRPGFGFRQDKQTGKVVFSTDRFTGYVWAIWEPSPRAETRLVWIDKPDVPEPMRLEHRRLARMAFDFAQEQAA